MSTGEVYPWWRGGALEADVLRALRTVFYREGAPALVDECYRALTGDPEAAPWLSSVVLGPSREESIERWARKLIADHGQVTP